MGQYKDFKEIQDLDHCYQQILLVVRRGCSGEKYASFC